MKKMLLIVFTLLITITLVGCSGKVKNDLSDYYYNDLSYGASRLSVLSNKEIERPYVSKTDGGLDSYPSPENPINDLELKELILNENKEILNFDQLDSEGNYYLKGEKTGGKLIKHTSADTQYSGTLEDSVKAYERTIEITPHEIGNSMTGLYVPAGEVIKVVIDKEDVNKGFTVDIGRGSQRGADIDIKVDRTFSRMPHIKHRVVLNKEVNYIGSPLGGALYINTNRKTSVTKITVSGAVEYPHYILGTTTKVELDRMLEESKGLMFDLEIPGIIRFTMPRHLIEDYSSEQIIKVANFWEKSGSLSNYIDQGSWYRTHVVTHIYDTHIPAGAAVAFVGASFSVSPLSWAHGVFNIDNFMKQGSWGDMHEFNHHHQGNVGMSGGGEVTNNVVSMLSYLEYTNISSYRNYETNSLTGWNRYVDPTSALKELNNITSKNTQLNFYVPLMHSFGVKQFVEAYRVGTGKNDSQFFRNFVDVLGYDMTYYFKDLNMIDLSAEDLKYARDKNYPMYIPVSTTYQVGQVQEIYNQELHRYNMEVIKTQQPYVLDVNEEININESIVYPNGFKLNVLNAKASNKGLITNLNGNYIYKPTVEEEYEEVFVDVSLTNGVYYSEQTLVLGFGVQKERASNMLTATVYSNDNNLVGLDNAQDYNNLVVKDTVKTNKADAYYRGSKNDVMVLEGQIVMPEADTYEFFITADDKAILYAGKTKNDLKEVARANEYIGGGYNKEIESSSFKIKLKANEQLFFKLISINNDGLMGSKIGYLNGDIISDIPSEFVYGFNGSISYKDYFTPLGSYEYRYNDVATISEEIDYSDATISVSDSLKDASQESINSIIDGNNFTGFHSKVNKSVFPSEFIIDYKSVKTFNGIELTSLRNESNPRGLPKDIKISISTDNINYQVVYNGKTNHQQINTFVLEKAEKARYVKLEVFTSHREGYIGIGEFKILNTINDARKINVINSQISLSGKFKIQTDGAYLNGTQIEMNNNTIKFETTSNSIAVFSTKGIKYGNMKIRVNGSRWQTINLFSEETSYNNLVFLSNNLNKKINKIEIKGSKKDLVNVDYFVISEK